jgi:CMP-N-acetylneuraminic acid synthetase
MKRLTALILACAFAPLAGAQLYKYVDKDGKTVYSDQPPLNTDSKQIAAPSAPAAASKSFLERDKELEKTRTENREKAKKSEETAKRGQEDQERCMQARTILQTYTDGGRIYKYNDKGERTFMEDNELDAARDKARRDVDEACKKA